MKDTIVSIVLTRYKEQSENDILHSISYYNLLSFSLCSKKFIYHESINIYNVLRS